MSISSVSPLWTPAEAGVFLGLHPKTVLRFAREKVIPALRLGKHWRFRAEDLTSWAAKQVESSCQPVGE
ncbi:helix-turn-helix domain-containing protein [Edaphobacter modestus]|uniref:Excisionase family DNA binding protein n=1 Tax=Edaphobacter modestus TaxID=388466 RepID=A0A4V6MFT9_9BACT|nr:excisionase family DNA binding protein [Edaphobacter modestus]